MEAPGYFFAVWRVLRNFRGNSRHNRNRYRNRNLNQTVTIKYNYYIKTREHSHMPSDLTVESSGGVQQCIIALGGGGWTISGINTG